MKPGGRAAVWSACADAVIEKRLNKAGLQVRAVPAKLYAQSRRAAYMIYVADKPLPPTGALRPDNRTGARGGKQR